MRLAEHIQVGKQLEMTCVARVANTIVDRDTLARMSRENLKSNCGIELDLGK